MTTLPQFIHQCSKKQKTISIPELKVPAFCPLVNKSIKIGNISMIELLDIFLENFCPHCHCIDSNFSLENETISVKSFINTFMVDVPCSNYVKSGLLYLSNAHKILKEQTYLDLINGNCLISFVMYNQFKVMKHQENLAKIYNFYFQDDFDVANLSDYLNKIYFKVEKIDFNEQIFLDIFKNYKCNDNKNVQLKKVHLQKSEYDEFEDMHYIMFGKDIKQVTTSESVVQTYYPRTQFEDFEDEESKFRPDITDTFYVIPCVLELSTKENIFEPKNDNRIHVDFNLLIEYQEIKYKDLKYINENCDLLFSSLVEKYNLNLNRYETGNGDRPMMDVYDDHLNFRLYGDTVNELKIAFIIAYSRYGKIIVKPEFSVGYYKNLVEYSQHFTVMIDINGKSEGFSSYKKSEAIRLARQAFSKSKGHNYNLDNACFNLKKFSNVARYQTTRNIIVYDHNEEIGIIRSNEFKHDYHRFFEKEPSVIFNSKTGKGITKSGFSNEIDGKTVELEYINKPILKIQYLGDSQITIIYERPTFVFFDGEFDSNGKALYCHISFQIGDTLKTYICDRFTEPNLNIIRKFNIPMFISDPAQDCKKFDLRGIKIVDIQPLIQQRFGMRGIADLMLNFNRMVSYEIEFFDRAQKSSLGKTYFSSLLEQICFYMLAKEIIP